MLGIQTQVLILTHKALYQVSKSLPHVSSTPQYLYLDTRAQIAVWSAPSLPQVRLGPPHLPRLFPTSSRSCFLVLPAVHRIQCAQCSSFCTFSCHFPSSKKFHEGGKLRTEAQLETLSNWHRAGLPNKAAREAAFEIAREVFLRVYSEPAGARRGYSAEVQGTTTKGLTASPAPKATNPQTRRLQGPVMPTLPSTTHCCVKPTTAQEGCKCHLPNQHGYASDSLPRHLLYLTSALARASPMVFLWFVCYSVRFRDCCLCFSTQRTIGYSLQYSSARSHVLPPLIPTSCLLSLLILFSLYFL